MCTIPFVGSCCHNYLQKIQAKRPRLQNNDLLSTKLRQKRVCSCFSLTACWILHAASKILEEKQNDRLGFTKKYTFTNYLPFAIPTAEHNTTKIIWRAEKPMILFTNEILFCMQWCEAVWRCSKWDGRFPLKRSKPIYRGERIQLKAYSVNHVNQGLKEACDWFTDWRDFVSYCLMPRYNRSWLHHRFIDPLKDTCWHSLFIDNIVSSLYLVSRLSSHACVTYKRAIYISTIRSFVTKNQINL